MRVCNVAPFSHHTAPHFQTLENVEDADVLLNVLLETRKRYFESMTIVNSDSVEENKESASNDAPSSTSNIPWLSPIDIAHIYGSLFPDRFPSVDTAPTESGWSHSNDHLNKNKFNSHISSFENPNSRVSSVCVDTLMTQLPHIAREGIRHPDFEFFAHHYQVG